MKQRTRTSGNLAIYPKRGRGTKLDEGIPSSPSACLLRCAPNLKMKPRRRGTIIPSLILVLSKAKNSSFHQINSSCLAFNDIVTNLIAGNNNHITKRQKSSQFAQIDATVLLTFQNSSSSFSQRLRSVKVF